MYPVLLFPPTLFAPTLFPEPSGAITVASTLEQAIVSRIAGSADLVALIGSRIEPHDVPQGGNDEPSYPCVVYRIVSDVHDHNLDGAAGVARAEIDFVARSMDFKDCQAIAEALRQLFDGYKGVIGAIAIRFTRLLPRASDYDPNDDSGDRGAHRKSSPFKFTYLETPPTF